MDPARSPIFIIGTGRSGTTLLRMMLCAHPRVYITHEASFYFWKRLFSPRASRRAFLEYYFQTDSFRWLRIDPDRVLAGLPDPLPPDRLAEAFVAIMREKAAAYGRVRFGDKTPAHTGCLAELFADFPDARAVHIVRDPRSTSLSLTRMLWGCRSLLPNVGYCASDWTRARKWRERLLQIRFEDLLADPRQTMGRVLEYVGEPWDEAVLDHANHLPDDHDLPPFPWLESAARPRGEPVSNWETMSPLDVRLVESLTRHFMREAGYVRAALPSEPGQMAVVREILRQVPKSLRYGGALLRLLLYLRDPAHFENEHLNALVHEINPTAWRRFPGFDTLPRPPAPPGERDRRSQ